MGMANKIIDFLMGKSIKKLEKKHKYLKLMKYLGISDLKPDFDSVYTHTLMEYSIDSLSGKQKNIFKSNLVPKEFIELFSFDSIRRAFNKDFLDGNDSLPTLNEEIERQFASNDKLSHIRNFFPNSESFKSEIETFWNLFKHFLKQSSDAFALHEYNELIKCSQKILSRLEKQDKKEFNYQVKNYLNALNKNFEEEFPADAPYIVLNGETRRGKKIETTEISDIESSKSSRSTIKKEIRYSIIPHVPMDIAINEWLKDENQHLLIMIGEYGTGKTSFCKHMSHNLALYRLEQESTGLIADPQKRIPLYFQLKYFEKNIDTFIVNQFNKGGITDISFLEFQKRFNDGEFILILDGFDEMTQRIDHEEKSKNFKKINDLIKNHPRSKIFLTTREEYFRSEEEFELVFRSKKKLRYIHLKPFNDEQIWEYLKTHSNKSDFNYKQIKRNLGLMDMAKRPVLLKLINECLPELIEKKDAKAIKATDLYKACIQREIERINEKFNFIIPGKYRLEVLKNVAVWLYLREEIIVDLILLERDFNIRRYFKSETPWEFEKHLSEFLTFTFLIREDDNLFRISHQSFRDYLLAQAFIEEINNGNIKNFSKVKLSYEVIKFILELNPDIDQLLKLVLTAKNLSEKNQWQGTNAANILLKTNGSILKGRDLTFCHLPHVNFKQCDLTKTDFSGANLRNCIFNKTIFDAELDNIDIEGSQLDLASQCITDINALKYFKQLQKLDLNHNEIQDITPLKKLRNLRHLNLSYNKIRDITPLKELRKLRNLNLSHNKIRDITPLKEVKNLTDLYLIFNQIEDITPLQNLRKLINLDLSYNQIKNLTPLNELKMLSKLCLFYNYITDIAPLKGLISLKHLYLSGNYIVDIKPLKELRKLNQLKLFYNGIKDITPLRELKQLNELFIGGNQVTESQTDQLKEVSKRLFIYD
jgi:Leucine-rich repeat (LRR) protein